MRKIFKMAKNSLYKIYILVILANIFWGFSFVWSDIALNISHIAPITLVSARMIVATILLGIWAKYTKNLQKIKFKHLKYFIGLAFCEPFLYFILELYGQTMVSPTVTSVIIATIPLFMPVMAFLFYKEKVNRATIIGIAVSMVGVLAIIFSGNSSISGQILGAVLIFGAVLAALGYNVFVKYIVQRYNATTLVFYQNLIGLIMLTPCFFIVDFAHLGKMSFDFRAISAILQLSIFASVLAFIFHSKAVKALGITKAGVFCYLIPVSTSIAAFFMVNERLTIVQWLGMAIVILGLFISQISKKK